mmetsp:Transcript_26469/g.103104  ORF Transcript_26469/g.103104 Transcript_26469/m.103104 type:complete len:145 (+) Transcript_26469:194-628(+)
MESMSERSGGFSFDNVERNHVLEDKGMKMPKAAKTGTTIVGVVYKDGVVLGADTRATSDTTVFEKYCEKIHYIAPNIYCCGAGTAADTEHTTAMIASKLELHRLDTVRWIFLNSQLGSACLKSNLTALPWTASPRDDKAELRLA